LRRANDCSRRGRGGGEHVLSPCDVRRYPKLEAEKERYVERDIFRERTRERERETVNTLIQTRAKITTF
jgi:hypothetical protein